MPETFAPTIDEYTQPWRILFNVYLPRQLISDAHINIHCTDQSWLPSKSSRIESNFILRVEQWPFSCFSNEQTINQSQYLRWSHSQPAHCNNMYRILNWEDYLFLANNNYFITLCSESYPFSIFNAHVFVCQMSNKRESFRVPNT